MQTETAQDICELDAPSAPFSTPWSRWMWGSIAAIVSIDAIWLLVTPISLSRFSVSIVAILLAGIAIGNWLTPKVRQYPQLHTVVTGGTMLLAAWPALRLFNHLSMTTAFPLADDRLASIDRAIGFDWLGYILWLDHHPYLMTIMSMVYGSLTYYSIALFLILALGRNAPERCAEFLKLFLIASISCMVMGMFFPALAAIMHYAPSPQLFHSITGRPGTYHLQALHELRTNPNVVLDLRVLPGLVTFPSFHTAMGVIAIYCARQDRALFAISGMVNLIMIASTPLYGAHYGIDIVGGAAVACIAILALRQASRISAASGLGKRSEVPPPRCRDKLARPGAG